MESILSIKSYENSKVEEAKNSLKVRLDNYTKTQAIHDGQRRDLITELELNILVLIPIKNDTQLTMEGIKEALGVASLLFNAKAQEDKAEKKSEELRKEININNHKRNDLIDKREFLPKRNLFKEQIAPWLLPIAIGFSCIDIPISFENFKIAYQPITAFLLSLGAASIVFASHLFGLWARKETNNIKYNYIRISVILISAATTFIMLGLLRSAAINSRVSTEIPTSDSITTASHHTSFWPYSLISFLMFAASFFITLFFSKSRKERITDEQHASIDKEINDLDKKLIELRHELKVLPDKVEAQKSEARVAFYYMERSIQECKAISKNALSEYKKVFVQMKGIVPECFSTHEELIYDDSFIADLKNYKQ
jgi:hypothetical protein